MSGRLLGFNIGAVMGERKAQQFVTREELDKVASELRSLVSTVELLSRESVNIATTTKALGAHVAKLSGTMESFMIDARKTNQDLIHALMGQVPAGVLPLSTHKEVVKGLIIAFSIVVITALGAEKIMPWLLKGL